MLAFFRMTIKGDELDPQEIQNKLDLPSNIYFKGSVIYKFGRPPLQKTNRWVYDINRSCKSSREIQSFLSKQLRIILSLKKILDEYTLKFKSCIEFIVYAERKADLTLSKFDLKALSQIGAEFVVAFN